ncbi:MAG: phosphatase PAP2 family protein [Pseudoxanthomonas suwonensis]|nr:phosphatase PAP2 family protein [Pseudoxanthomonas suwonensis]
MFEVDTNLWLQQFDAAWMLGLMELISALGQSEVYMPLLLAMAFGVAFRPGLGLLLGMLVAGAATNAMKLGFALPRPSEVDVRVLNKGESGRALVEHGAATEFFGLPSEEAVAVVRAAGRLDYGFISGHASAAAAFAIGIVLLFGLRRHWVWAVALSWTLLMGLSRMYLGRHFLGDVLGGWMVGAMAAWLAWLFVRAIEGDRSGKRRLAWALAWSGIAAWMLLSLRRELLEPAAAGGIAGILICLWVMTKVPHHDGAGIGKRCLRVLCALIAGYGIDAVLRQIWQAGGLPDGHALGFLNAAVGYTVALLGTWWLATHLRLYPQSRMT